MTTDEPPGVQYALTAGPADLGARVVLRRRLPDGRYADLLGELVQWDAEVVVRDRDGRRHAVPRPDVVAAKRVPPAPARRSR